MVLIERSVEVAKGKYHMHQQCIPHKVSELPAVENVLIQSAERSGFGFEVSFNWDKKFAH